jgi:transcriptional regulator, XRE family|nr:MAG TPA: repressor protein [Caudoviricetes sp.]
MKEFKVILARLMNEFNMDQKELANKTGLTQATISRYTLGKAIPTGENLGIIADVFDVSVDYLLGRTNIREINKGKEDKFEVLAAHKADSNSDVKNIPGLKDLLREIVKEELGK